MGIRINGLSKIYNKGKSNENMVLKDVSLEIKKGEMIAIIGKSGAGKSTLLHILGCLDRATQGEYVLDGICINNLNEKKLASLRNEKIGFILQDFGLISEDSVLENVMLPMMFDDTPIFQIRKKAIEALKAVNMEKLLQHKVSTLSGGEKQRTAIARALVKNPEYILADEPTGALDTENSRILMKSLKSINKEGKTVIIVTHDMDVANRCERMIEIEDGKVRTK